MPTEILRPNANGATNNLFPNTGTNWENVDETSPDADTTYNHTGSETDSVVDRYELQATALTTETVDSVDVWLRVKSAAAAGGTHTLWHQVVLGGIGVQSASQSYTDSYVNYERAAMARPGGGSWAASDLNGTGIGIRLQESNSVNQGRVTQAWLEVNYTAAAAAGSTWWGAGWR